MTQYRSQFNIIFKFIIIGLVAIGCDRTTKSNALELNIDNLVLTQQTNAYSITINDAPAGNSTIAIKTGILKSFQNIQYSQVIEIKETTSINNQSNTHEFYVKNKTDGYILLSENSNTLNKMMVSFPLKSNEKMNGPFSGISTSNVTLLIRDVHHTFTNHNGHVFNNVIEASNSDDTIRVFMNNDHFIVQKEDLRYVPIIHSLTL